MTLNIATRKSPMALWQAHFIRQKIQEKHPTLTVRLIELSTPGDDDQRSPLTKIGGKSVFVKTLQHALLEGKADIAVHSGKDLSVYPVDGLTLAAVYKRDDPRDVFLSNHHASLAALPEGANVGTASPRRQSLIKSLRPDVNVTLLRGNLGTRLQKLDDGQHDAIILAAAGLHRMQKEARIKAYFDPEDFIPAIAQGALAIECRDGDLPTRARIEHLEDKTSAVCVSAERAVNQVLGGDCHTPVGAFATLNNGKLSLRGMVGSLDGNTILRSQITGKPEEAVKLGQTIAHDLLEQGAWKLIPQD